ncbi:MAG: hypothetical protein ACNYZG_09220 [Gammaproteobacteria bacterium]
MKVYEDEKWTAILNHLMSSGVKERLSSWERKFLGPCLAMNDKRIALSDKQQKHLIRIYRSTLGPQV